MRNDPPAGLLEPLICLSERVLMMILVEMTFIFSTVPSLRWLWTGSTGALALRDKRVLRSKRFSEKASRITRDEPVRRVRRGYQKLCLGAKSALLVRMKQVPSPASYEAHRGHLQRLSGINSKALPSSRFVWILWSPWADFDESTFKNIVRRALETLVARQVLNYKGSAMAGGWRQARLRGSGSIRCACGTSRPRPEHRHYRPRGARSKEHVHERWRDSFIKIAVPRPAALSM